MSTSTPRYDPGTFLNYSVSSYLHWCTENTTKLHCEFLPPLMYREHNQTTLWVLTSTDVQRTQPNYSVNSYLHWRTENTTKLLCEFLPPLMYREHNQTTLWILTSTDVQRTQPNYSVSSYLHWRTENTTKLLCEILSPLMYREHNQTTLWVLTSTDVQWTHEGHTWPGQGQTINRRCCRAEYIKSRVVHRGFSNVSTGLWRHGTSQLIT